MWTDAHAPQMIYRLSGSYATNALCHSVTAYCFFYCSPSGFRHLKVIRAIKVERKSGDTEHLESFADLVKFAESPRWVLVPFD